MFEELQNLAAARGFARLYALPPADLSAWRENARLAGVQADLVCDVPGLYPWATAVLLLVKAYVPYPPACRIPAYYIASNQGYHAHKALCADIAALGFRCERAELPARAAALASGVGAQGKNGLLRIQPFGSRIVLYTLVTNACPPQPVKDATPPCPPGCTACAQACPAHAIGSGAPALTQRKCMRYYMDDPPYPDWVPLLQTKHMGCESCMDACPFNEAIGVCAPAPEIAAAFALARLAQGDDAAARALVGKNMTRRHKLTLEAQAFLERANSGNKDDL